MMRAGCSLFRTMIKTMLLVLVLAAPAAAEPQPAAPALEGKFAFDWNRPKSSKCVKVTGKLRATLEKSYTCRAPRADDSGSASGKPIVAICPAKKGESEYLVLGTLA